MPAPTDIQALAEKVILDGGSGRRLRRTKDGNLLDIWMTATMLSDDSGHPIEMAVTERDPALLA